MATAEDIVTGAIRLLGQMDVEELAPSPAQMSLGLRTLESMVKSWETKSLNIVDVVTTGAVTIDSAIITGIPSTAKLAPGLNVSGTGVSGRILTVDSSTQITLTADATASGSEVDLTFTALPFEAKFERGVMALLAMDLAHFLQEAEIPPFVVAMASDGWTALSANFRPNNEVTVDPALIVTSIGRRLGSW